jgi:hypothetical protein
MTLAQFAIARVAAGLERNAEGLTAGEARLLSEVLAPAVARYALDDGAAESPALSTGEGRAAYKSGEVSGARSPARKFGGWYPC